MKTSDSEVAMLLMEGYRPCQIKAFLGIPKYSVTYRIQRLCKLYDIPDNDRIKLVVTLHTLGVNNV